MQIDNDHNGHPTAMLMSASIPDEPDQDGKFMCVFIPISDILALRHSPGLLIGHPWLDIPAENIVGLKRTKSQVARIKRYLASGRYIAISASGKRGKRSKGVKLDRAGEPIIEYHCGWRKPEDYLSEDEMLWLKAVSEESYRFSETAWAVVAIAEWLQRLGRYVESRQARPPKKARKRKEVAVRMKAKERRNLERQSIYE